MIYILPMEILTRMCSVSPFVPYEMGKYLFFIVIIYGLFLNGISKLAGIFLFIILLPGIYIGYFIVPDYKELVFNVLGMINLSLAICFFQSLRFSIDIDMHQIVRLMTYVLLSALVFTILKTPNYEEIDFGLNAKSDTSGGFGSNQVSTAFGLGMFLSFYMWLKNKRVSGFSRIVDLILSLSFLFQGLLTFSRGGIIGGVVGIILFIISTLFSKKYINRSSIKFKLFFLGLPLLILIIFFANTLTNGNLFLRYQGETQGTLNGTREKDFNHLTTNRFDIFIGDMQLFENNIFLGVGVGVSKYVRPLHNGTPSHVEFSRLLAEHGFLGLIFIFIITILFFKKLYLFRSENVILLILGIIALYSTFHGATRTFISPLLFPLLFFKTKKSNVKYSN